MLAPLFKGQRFWPGRYVLFHAVFGDRFYWLGTVANRIPDVTADPDQARGFVSARHAYTAARDFAPLLDDWRAERMATFASETKLDEFGSSIADQADYWLDSLARNSRGDEEHLGLPRSSAEQQANKGGTEHVAELSEEDALSDKALAQLRQRHRSVHYDVIYRQYFLVEPIETLEARYRVSRTQAYRMRTRAQEAFWRLRESIGDAL